MACPSVEITILESKIRQAVSESGLTAVDIAERARISLDELVIRQMAIIAWLNQRFGGLPLEQYVRIPKTGAVEAVDVQLR